MVDYRAILRKLLNVLPAQPPVLSVTADFEAALWQAVREVLGDGVQLRGCAFHIGQALFRKVQELGLQRWYNMDEATNRYCRNVMCLSMLPAMHITPTFDQLNQQCPDDALQQWMDYVDTTWICGAVWTPTDWSLYGRAIRTNNDVEGWHHRINTKARKHGRYSFYQLCGLLAEEARLVTVQTRLIGQHKLRRRQRTVYRRVQGRIFELWDRYDAGDISVMHLLRHVSRVYGP